MELRTTISKKTMMTKMTLSPNEVGVTNLGPVPEGMTFLQAIRQSAPQRKYVINPLHQSRRLTVCETMREIWRISEEVDPEHGNALKELAAAGFDFGKRMDARMRQLRSMAFSS
jgi:hypothetical protein